MTTSLPEITAEREQRLSQLILSLPPYELESVRLSLDGHELILEGRIASYEAKRRMETAARAAGFQVKNGLRVTPAIVQFVPPDFSPTEPASPPR
ncbi:MAG: hypothetical protein GEU75_03440 [Dehalococcoidia bacterium]|nr:hypothetical protein [Dehalococcoidia bacterium]